MMKLMQKLLCGLVHHGVLKSTASMTADHYIHVSDDMVCSDYIQSFKSGTGQMKRSRPSSKRWQRLVITVIRMPHI